METSHDLRTILYKGRQPGKAKRHQAAKMKRIAIQGKDMALDLIAPRPAPTIDLPTDTRLCPCGEPLRGRPALCLDCEVDADLRYLAKPTRTGITVIQTNDKHFYD